MRICSAKDLKVYQKAFGLAMEIFHLSKRWPKAETYSLTDQIRRSSRSVCSNLQEAWDKGRYKAHFVSKLTDADGENSETSTWIDFALKCGYIESESHTNLSNQCLEVGKMFGSIIKNPDSSLIK